MRYGYDMKIRILVEEEAEVPGDQEIRIYYVLDGELLLTMENTNYRLGDGGLLAVNAAIPHKYEKGRGTLAIEFSISREFLTELTKNPIISFECSSAGHNSAAMEELRSLLKRALSFHVNSGFLDKIREYSYCYDVLEHLIRYFSVWNMSWQQGGEQENRLGEILSYIQSNYDKPLSLQDLADKFYLSVPYLSKYIKNHLGMGFTEYINDIRMHHAIDELLHTDFSVTKIAYDNGFSNLLSFNRAFKQKYEKTPSAYRKERLERKKKKQGALSEQESVKLVKQYFQNNPIQDQNGHWVLKAEADAQISRSYEKNGLKVLNLGEAADLQQGYVQEHIVFLKEELNFEYGRIWRLFCHENMIDPESGGIYNFSRLFQILDFLLEHQIKPFLNLGSKPKKIVTTNMQSVMEAKKDRRLGDLRQYKRLLTEFIRQCVVRYGLSVVETWKFECWWNRDDIELVEISPRWIELFDMEYGVIKEQVPKAQVGGMGFNVYDSNEAIRHYLESIGPDHIVPDFLSVSMYPYDKNGVLGGSYIVTDENFIEKELDSIRALLTEYGMAEMPLYVTEWNLSISSRDALNDTCYKAAYIMKNLIASEGKTACMAYWGSTDRIDEYFDFVSCLNGGSGLLSRDGIKKPAFYAMAFMSRLARNLLAKGDHYMITATNHGSYFIICHNMQQPDLDYYLSGGEKQQKDVLSYFGKQELQLDVCLQNMKAVRYQMRKYYVNQDAGSVFDEWARMGYVENADREEIEYLRFISTSRMQSELLQAERGNVCFSTLMEANEIQLIHLMPVY